MADCNHCCIKWLTEKMQCKPQMNCSPSFKWSQQLCSVGFLPVSLGSMPQGTNEHQSQAQAIKNSRSGFVWEMKYSDITISVRTGSLICKCTTLPKPSQKPCYSHKSCIGEKTERQEYTLNSHNSHFWTFYSVWAFNVQCFFLELSDWEYLFKKNRNLKKNTVMLWSFMSILVV